MFVIIAVCLQIGSGAYQAELSSYPDESAQAVAGIAVERYVAHHLDESPLAYARTYYVHYPKVAIGHWPPLLYAVQAAAMLVFSPSKETLLGVQALLAGILAWLVFRELRPLVDTGAAVLGSIALLANPVIQHLSSMTMAELLLTITMFLACLRFARFAEHRRTADALWFGVWTAAAIMTKGTGWVMPLVAVAVILAMRDWKLPFERALRPAALIVAICCVPWQLITMKSVVNGWYDSPSLALAARLAGRYTLYLFTLPGIIMGIAGVAGAVYTLHLTWKGDRSQAYWAALVGLVAASWLFNVVVPTSEEPRKVIMIIPPLFVLAAAGTRGLAHRIFPNRQRLASGILFSALALLTIAFSFPLRAKPRLGFEPVAADLVQLMPNQSAALVVSDSFGEGALISEFALRRPDPAVYLLRGSKLLASQTWDTSHYFSRVHSAEQCGRVLESVPVSFLVVDHRKDVYREDYFNSVDALLRSPGVGWQLLKLYPSGGDPAAIALYRRAAGVTPLQSLPSWLLPQTPGSAQ